MGITPIQTRYKGYRFRSRLEARWAVFFDTLCVKWEYEKEGYDLGKHGWYLPDFFLPDLKIWVEVKPNIDETTEEEQLKVQALVDGTGFVGAIVGELIPRSIGFWVKNQECWYIDKSNDSSFIDQMFPGMSDPPKLDDWYNLNCAVCGGEYVHVKSCAEADCGFSYLTFRLSFECEYGCKYDLLIGNHKGWGVAILENAKTTTTSLIEFLTKGNSARAQNSLDRAKSARFEHGENPHF